MAETSFPWNSTGSDQVTEEVWRNMHYAASDVVLPTSTGNGLLVSASGSTVTVQPGSALVQGSLYTSTLAKTFDLSTIGTSPTGSTTRWVWVVLRYDPTAQRVTSEIVAGVPGASPVLPQIAKNRPGVWEVPLAKIRQSVGGVASGDVYDMRPQPTRFVQVPAGVSDADLLVISGAHGDTFSRGGELLRRNGQRIDPLSGPAWETASTPSTISGSVRYAVSNGFIALRGRPAAADGRYTANTMNTLCTIPILSQYLKEADYRVPVIGGNAWIVGQLSILPATGQVRFYSTSSAVDVVHLDAVQIAVDI